MITIRLATALFVALCAFPACAMDAGAASGRYAKDGVRIDVSHAIALMQDNAEGLLDHGPQMRVLLSDHAVPVEALYGIAFPPVRDMAAKGELKGLLLEFNPTDRNSMRVTILSKPSDPTEFAPTLSLSDSNGLWKRLTSDGKHVEGDYKDADQPGLAFTFNAPVTVDPVVADLKGPAAKSSEQVRILTARATAMTKGDMAAAAALSTRQAGADLQSMPAAERKQVVGAMSEMLKQIKAIKRVVVRQKTAVALLGDGSWSSFVLEDGAWKVAD